MESSLSGQAVMSGGSNYTTRLNWAKSQYTTFKSTYTNLGVDPSRLFFTEYFSNNSNTSDYFGRAGLASASDWDSVIMIRQDAIKQVGIAGYDAYDWGHNAMLVSEAEQIQHERYYRTRLVLAGQQPQWLPDDAYTIGDSATPVPLSWNQTLNWIGSGVVKSLPNSVPNSAGAVANFYKTN